MVNTREQIASAWQQEGARPSYSGDALANSNLPESTKDFFRRVGMPLSEGGFLYLNRIHGDLPHLSTLVAKEDVVEPRPDLRVFAEYGDSNSAFVYYCVSEPDGEIVCLSRGLFGALLRPSFANSGIWQFVEFILVFRAYQRWFIARHQYLPPATLDLPTDEIANEVSKTIGLLEACDPAAVLEAKQFLADDVPNDQLVLAGTEWTSPVVRMHRTGFWE